ncbi:MAG TPA: PRTRC system protein C [Verrucomicrobiae bacterium]|jgi:PRTRC genetic system protein C|nr:PRTRC system protein C [Verrucomicrobiae bacterium]
MPLEASNIARKFVYKGTELADPNPVISVEQARDILSTDHPELATAAIDGPVMKGNVQTYTFIVSAGTKG